MKHYSSPDDLAASAFALADERGTIHAQSITVAGGERCAHCHGPQTKRINAKGEWINCCADCWKPWVPVLIESVKTKARRAEMTFRQDATENSVLYRLDEWMVLEPIVYRRPRAATTEQWIWTLSAWRLYLHPMLGSFESVAEYGMRWAGRSADAWTPTEVERAISQGRSVVQARASRSPWYLLPRNGRTA